MHGLAEFSYSRIIFLISGTALMTIAWALSQSLIFYYGSAMALGVLLVILMILYQVLYGVLKYSSKFCFGEFYNSYFMNMYVFIYKKDCSL